MIRRLLLVLAVAATLIAVVRWSPMPPPSSAAVGSFGQGPTIVLVHGLGSDASRWLPVARELAPNHRVVLIELPGHGLTPMVTPFALEQATLALDRALQEKTKGPVLLVGHSVGGLVVAAEALREPERVHAVVLVETALRPQFTTAERESLLANLDHDWEDTLHGVYSSFGRDPAQGEQLWRDASKVEREKMRAWIRVALSTDLSGQVSDLRVPVLAVLASRSWGPDETWNQVADSLGYSRIPRLSSLRLDRSGHFVMLDQPEELAAAIRGFGIAAERVLALQ